METGATILGPYRYTLWRVWNTALPRVAFILLNPSTADAKLDDPTVRRCVGFARAWGFGSLELVNLFAYRATHPRELKTAPDPVGPANDDTILQAVSSAQLIVVGWGTHGGLYGRDRAVLRLLPDSICSLGATRDGFPRHPLYLKQATAPVPYLTGECPCYG
jgi:hypothetical protein